MKALVLNCTLKKSPNQSNSGLLAGEVVSGLQEFGVECEMVRLVDVNILPGVLSDEGDGDEWPGGRRSWGRTSSSWRPRRGSASSRRSPRGRSSAWTRCFLSRTTRGA